MSEPTPRATLPKPLEPSERSAAVYDGGTLDETLGDLLGKVVPDFDVAEIRDTMRQSIIEDRKERERR